ncbi:hypothetical protein FRC15_006149 [Serendipita sp. 397]|nr:hypothetical protein FRC15_006149 [Serendipita sp. 397]KAG8803596.1 hypothetical protein FRC18_007254 [Serendipita sp. 400]
MTWKKLPDVEEDQTVAAGENESVIGMELKDEVENGEEPVVSSLFHYAITMLMKERLSPEDA